MNKYKRIINDLECKIEILKINKPYANCPECCQKDIDELQEIKNAMEELAIKYAELAVKNRELTKRNELLDNDNFELRTKLNIEEADYVMLEKHLKNTIKKETPEKPTYSYDGYADGFPVIDYAECPSCGSYFDYQYEDHYKYCPDCGQRLDWEIEENEDV